MHNYTIEDFCDEFIKDIGPRLCRSKRNLFLLKEIVDAYYNRRIHVTVNNDDFNVNSHTYDLNVIMGLISNYVYTGLGMNVPTRESIDSSFEEKEREKICED